MVPCLSAVAVLICSLLAWFLLQPVSMLILTSPTASSSLALDRRHEHVLPSPWQQVVSRHRRYLDGGYDSSHGDGGGISVRSIVSTCSGTSASGSHARSPCNYRARAATRRSSVSLPSKQIEVLPIIVETCEACGQFWSSIIGLNYCCRCNDKVFAFCYEAVHGSETNY